jgi:Uma2 family endonuclease
MKSQNCRAPDISFVSRARLKALGFRRSTRSFFPEAPGLAVEVLSPSNTRREIDERLIDFFASGTKLAWIIDPDAQHVEICHSPANCKLVASGGFLEVEELLPGFRYAIADLFKEWDWE